MTNEYGDDLNAQDTAEDGIGLDAGVTGADLTGFSPSAGSAVTRTAAGLSDAGMAAGSGADDEIGTRGDVGNEGSAGEEWNDSGVASAVDDTGEYAMGAGTAPTTGEDHGGGPDAAEREELGMGGGTSGYLNGGEGDEGT